MGISILGADLDNMRDALTIKAKEISEKIARKDIKKRETKSTKLRQYYQAVIQCLNKKNKTGWIEFYMLKPKVFYDRQRRLVNDSFVDFISSAVDRIKEDDIPSLEKFKSLFEAVVGFFPKSTSN